jgi:predicted nucleotidyltransferase
MNDGVEMELHPLVTVHPDDVRTLCKKYGVDTLEVFGSAMTPEFDPARSDVDFLVHYPDGYDVGMFGKRLSDFEAELSELLARPAQLVMMSALRDSFFSEEANRTRSVIYVASEVDQVSEGRVETLPIHH